MFRRITTPDQKPLYLFASGLGHTDLTLCHMVETRGQMGGAILLSWGPRLCRGLVPAPEASAGFTRKRRAAGITIPALTGRGYPYRPCDTSRAIIQHTIFAGNNDQELRRGPLVAGKTRVKCRRLSLQPTTMRAANSAETHAAVCNAIVFGVKTSQVTPAARDVKLGRVQAFSGFSRT